MHQIEYTWDTLKQTTGGYMNSQYKRQQTSQLFSQASNAGMASGSPYAMAGAAALSLYGPVIDKKISGEQMSPLEGAQWGALSWGPLAPIGAYKGYMDAKEGMAKQEVDQKRIQGEYQNWMQRDAKPYDTEGFYQIPQMKYGGGIKVKNMMYAMGGRVPIEVEGEETFVYPNGKMEDIKGPTHEEGGVPMQAKEGSRVYSNRVKARQDIIDRLKNY